MAPESVRRGESLSSRLPCADDLASKRFADGLVPNNDSFTYNLVQYLGELGAEVSTALDARLGGRQAGLSEFSRRV